MFFTQEDYRKIEKWLLANSRKDTEFAGAATPLKGNETVVLVQGGKNVKASVEDIVKQLFLLGVSDFVNITDKYNESYISLSQAIELIPFRSRKVGQVITFLNEEGKWNLYQFQGTSKNQWNMTTLWVNLINLMKGLTIIDSEDIVAETNNVDQVALKFADKIYNTADYSGLGRVYLRKNIVDVKDPVTGDIVTINYLQQSMIDKENTIYIIQYDYNLNKQTITIPEGCVLLFEGGTLTNGIVQVNNTDFIGKEFLYKDITLGNYSGVVNFSWFKTYDHTTVEYFTKIGLDIYFPEGTYVFDNTITVYSSPQGIPSNIYGDSNHSSILVFNVSDGLTYAYSTYYKYGSLHDLSIRSLGYCVNLAPDDLTTRMLHMWKFKFYNLTLSSTNKSCIYADDNVGINNTPNMLYECSFKDIFLDFATYGIEGVYGLSIVFDNVSDELRKVAEPISIFRNCDGVFRNINTTMTVPKHFLLIDEKHRPQYNCTIKFDSVNMETLTDSAIKITNNQVAVVFDFWETYIQYYPNAMRNFLMGDDKTITFFPIDITLLNAITGTPYIRVYNGASFEEGKQYIATNLQSSRLLYNDRERTIYLKSLNKPVVFTAGYGKYQNLSVSNSSIPVTYTPNLSESYAKRLDIETIRNRIATIPCSDLFNQVKVSEPRSLTNLSTNVPYTVNYYYTGGDNNMSYDGTLITFKNVSDNPITFKHNAQYNFRLYNIEGKDVVINRDEYITYMFLNKLYYQVNTATIYKLVNDWVNIDGTLQSKVTII